MGVLLRWVASNPAETAWIAFLAVSALVAAYRTQEAKIHAHVKATRGTADDKFVGVLDAFVGIFGVLRLFVPHMLGRPAPPEAPPESPPPAPPESPS